MKRHVVHSGPFRYLIRTLQNTKAPVGVRRQAIFWLTESRKKRAVPAFLRLLKSSNPADRKLRIDLIHGLHWFEDRRAVPLAVEILGNRRESKVVRVCAAYLFHRFADSRATPVLIQVLMNPREPSGLRTYCAEALGNCRRGKRAVVKALITCLTDADPYVRTFSALALAFCGNQSAAEPLKKLRSDKTPVPPYGKVADDAKYALTSIQEIG